MKNKFTDLALSNIHFCLWEIVRIDKIQDKFFPLKKMDFIPITNNFLTIKNSNFNGKSNSLNDNFVNENGFENCGEERQCNYFFVINSSNKIRLKKLTSFPR